MLAIPPAGLFNYMLGTRQRHPGLLHKRMSMRQRQVTSTGVPAGYGEIRLV